MGRGHQGAPQGHLRPDADGGRLLARAVRRRARPNDGRIINTTSVSGIYGNAGQTNYGAAKTGIAAFTIIAALELGRYGVTVNAIAPGSAHPHDREPRAWARPPRRPKEMMSPRWIAPVAHVARVAAVGGRHRAGVRSVGPTVRRRRGLAPRPDRRAGRRPDAVDAIARDLLAKARPNADMNGQDRKD